LVFVLLSLLLNTSPGALVAQGPLPQKIQEPILEGTPPGSVPGIPDVIAEDMP
jgi:hypothetical protein